MGTGEFNAGGGGGNTTMDQPRSLGVSSSLPSLAPEDGKKREPGNELGNGPASHAGESRNTPSHKRDKLRTDGPLGSYADLL